MYTANESKIITANKSKPHAANEREINYAHAFQREGLTPSSKLIRFAPFFEDRV